MVSFLLELPHRPETGASAAGIAGYFLCGRGDSFAVEYGDLGFMIALTDGKMGWADAILALVSKIVLDNAIF